MGARTTTLLFLVASAMGMLWRWSGAAVAAPTPASVGSVLDFFFTESLLEKAVPAIEVAMAHRRKEAKLTAPQEQSILSHARRIFPAKNLNSTLRTAYAKITSTGQLQSLHDWQVSVAGIKFHRTLETGWTVTPDARSAYLNGPGRDILKPNRRNAITTFVTESKLDVMSATIKAAGDYAVLAAFNAYAPKSRQEPLPIIKKGRAVPLLDQYKAQASNDWQTFMAYAVKELKNAEVDDLTRFATSVVGESHATHLLKALDITLDAAVVTLAREIDKARSQTSVPKGP